MLLLLLGAALHESAGQDLRPRDQRTPCAQGAAGQLFGGDDHAEVIGLAARGEAAVLLGNRQPETTHLGQSADDVLRDVGVRPMDVLGDRSQLVLGEAPERVLHHLEVLVEVTRPFVVGQ